MKVLCWSNIERLVLVANMNPAVQELSIEEINGKFSEYMKSPENAERAANYLFDAITEDLIMGVVFEFHHGIKTGLTDLLEGDNTTGDKEDPLHIVNNPECDVFGLSIVKKPPDCNCSCPNCDRPVSATRFAPHLEKCMGMGRNSSRIASRRIASNSKEPVLYAGLLSDDDDDADWVGDRRKKKLRNNGVRKQVKLNGNSKASTSNGGNSDNSNWSQDAGGATYETMKWTEKKNLLLQICGVVSEHTKKICTRSTRCPQHTEEQRKALRNSVLEPPPTSEPSTPEQVSTAPTSANEVGSPPDSSPSSTCSSSSRKRDKHRSKNTKAKKEKLNLSPGRD